MSDDLAERAREIAERGPNLHLEKVDRILDELNDSIAETQHLVEMRQARLEGFDAGYEAGFRDGRRSRRWWR